MPIASSQSFSQSSHRSLTTWKTSLATDWWNKELQRTTTAGKKNHLPQRQVKAAPLPHLQRHVRSRGPCGAFQMHAAAVAFGRHRGAAQDATRRLRSCCTCVCLCTALVELSASFDCAVCSYIGALSWKDLAKPRIRSKSSLTPVASHLVRLSQTLSMRFLLWLGAP